MRRLRLHAVWWRRAAACYSSRVRAAGIDLGTARVGLAVSDELGVLAHPRPHLEATSPGRLVEALARLADAESIEVFVVGLPRTLGGIEGLPAKRARRFAELLRERTARRVELVDEWLTTREASRKLTESGLSVKQQRSRVDSAAAAVLLQSWLDAVRTPS